jgi:hypothetical protein
VQVKLVQLGGPGLQEPVDRHCRLCGPKGELELLDAGAQVLQPKTRDVARRGEMRDDVQASDVERPVLVAAGEEVVQTQLQLVQRREP